MPDPISPPATDPTPPVTPPVTPPAPATDNSVIQGMRAQLEQKEKERKEFESKLNETAAKLRERENADLSETEKLKRENEELKPVRDAHGKYSSKLETLYNQQLETVPEEKREAVKTLSASGDWSDRLNSLEAAVALLPNANDEPRAMGRATQPSAGAATGDPQPFDPANRPRMRDILAARARK